MSTPNPEDPQRLDGDPHRDGRPRSHIGSLLWIVLLVALIAAGVWWYNEETGVVPPPPNAAAEPPAGEDHKAAAVIPDGSAIDGAKDIVAPAVTQPAPPKTQPKPKPIASVPLDRAPVPLASNRQPRYPGQALRSGVEGSVSVLIEIDAQGVPTDVRVVSRRGERSRDLDRAVVSAARAWRFDPALRNGQPVPGEVILPVDFQRN